MTTILVASDICPIGVNEDLFRAGDVARLFNDLLPEFREASLAIANLECPFITERTPILKTGPSFGEPPACVNGIKQAGIGVLCLANNHIMDHGAAGLKSTLDTCAANTIDTVGAGDNLAAARRILIKEINGTRIGILAAAECEFSIATKHSPGANPLDVVDIVRNICERRSSYDYLVVLLHGGDEFQVPTPRLQTVCRFLIEMGAGAVVVQHPHVLGGWEEYQGGHIVYGQGALIMDETMYRGCKSFHEGFLVKLSIAGRARATMEIVPFTQSDPVPGARRMPQEQEPEWRRRLEERSRAIKEPAFVEAEWLEFCEGRKHDYVSALLGHNRILARLNKRGLIEKIVHGRLPLLRAKNVACCETHREAIQTIFDRHLV